MTAPFTTASRHPVWLDSPAAPAPRPPLHGDRTVDLLVIGAGYSGLWTALLAAESNPGRSIAVVESYQVGWAASGRNGGFCEASLTHGSANGQERFPAEFATLQRLGQRNLSELRDTIRRHGIDCDLEETGELTVATEPYQVPELRAAAEDGEGDFLDRDAVRAEVDSPTYLAGLWDRSGCLLVQPAKLAWGLADAAESRGVSINDGTRVTRLRARSGYVEAESAGGVISAHRIALATNVFPSLLRRVRSYVLPVYDYAIATEPLSPERLESVGWRHRQGIGDSGNQFHYYRLTADDRIVFGGYDAVYHFGKRLAPANDQRPTTFRKLASHFRDTFPQLGDVPFTHTWGGAIDLCSRFCAFFGTAYDGAVAYAAGYTGLGVGATRFGAQVMLDLLDGADTERTRLELVRSKPVPFPPEPLAFLGVQATRASLAAADRNDGRRNLWLRGMDRLGLGYDS